MSIIDLTRSIGLTGALPVGLSEAEILDTLAESRTRFPGARHDAAWKMHADQAREFARRDSNLNAARDLKYVFEQVLEEVRPPLMFSEAFPINTSVPAGAETFEFERELGRGKPAPYMGGSAVERVTTSIERQDFPIRTYAVAIEGDIFSDAANAFAGRANRAQRDLRKALQRFDELLDQISFTGDIATGLRGVLDAKFVGRTFGSVAFNDTAAADDILDRLHAIANRPANQSNQAITADRMIMSPRVFHFLAGAKRSTGTDMSILDAFLQDSPYINTKAQIIVAPRMANPDGDGLDAVVAYRRDQQSIQHILAQAPTVLPTTRPDAIRRQTIVVARTGGMVSNDPVGVAVEMVTPPSA